MAFTESTTFPTIQDMLSSYFYAGEEEEDTPEDFAARLKADNPPDWLAALRAELATFLAGDAEFGIEFLSYFSPPDPRAWLRALLDALG